MIVLGEEGEEEEKRQTVRWEGRDGKSRPIEFPSIAGSGNTSGEMGEVFEMHGTRCFPPCTQGARVGLRVTAIEAISAWFTVSLGVLSPKDDD